MSEGTEIAVKMSFEEKLKERMKEQIGELLSDDDLKKIVEKGIQTIFFDRPIVGHEQYSGKPIYSGTPLAEELVNKYIKERVEVALQQWATEHPDAIKDILEKQIGANALDFVQHGIASLLSSPFEQFKQQIAWTLQQNANNLMQR